MAHQRPHFLHIGPERSGTTWLNNMLNQHPDVRLNPVKEVRYFFEAWAHPGEGLLGRFLNRDWHNASYRTILRRRLKFYLKHLPVGRVSRTRFLWDCNYLFGRRSDDWFESLFDSKASVVTGDFSPQTYFISNEHIDRIAREWPATRVMMTLREPVEWMWSAARLWLFDRKAPSDVSDAEFLNFVAQYPYPSPASISAWQNAFAGRFQLLYFDELTSAPVEFLVRVCRFLGLATDPIRDFTDISDKRYSSPSMDLPPRLRRLLIDTYEPQVRDLAEHFGSYPRQWLAQYRQNGPLPSPRW